MNLGKQRCCISSFFFFLSSFCLLSAQGRRGVGFLRCFVLWPAERPSGKPELAGGGASSGIECHRVSSTSVYFLFICRKRDMDTSLSLSLPSLSQARLLSLFPPLCSLFSSSSFSVSFIIRSHGWSKFPFFLFVCLYA